MAQLGTERHGNSNRRDDFILIEYEQDYCRCMQGLYNGCAKLSEIAGGASIASPIDCRIGTVHIHAQSGYEGVR